MWLFSKDLWRTHLPIMSWTPLNGSWESYTQQNVASLDWNGQRRDEIRQEWLWGQSCNCEGLGWWYLLGLAGQGCQCSRTRRQWACTWLEWSKLLLICVFMISAGTVKWHPSRVREVWRKQTLIWISILFLVITRLLLLECLNYYETEWNIFSLKVIKDNKICITYITQRYRN